jgi:hypothetical protein
MRKVAVPDYSLGMKIRRTLTLVVCLALLAAPDRARSSIEKIKTEYQTVSAKLAKHVVEEQWIDNDSESPRLLVRQWSLAGEWVAAWLNAHPHAGPEGVKAALARLANSPASQHSWVEPSPEYLELNATTFLVVAPSPIGNVFIVSKSGDDYRVAWSTAQVQETSGESAEVLAAWRAENARLGGRGPYWVASGSAGSVQPARLAMLPTDANGHPRFYIEGIYAQGAGSTIGEQISLWVWDGVTARPQLTRDYAVYVDQDVATRIEGDLLKVQQKKFFRTLSSCGDCEERQTDWIVRITPEGMKELGEKSLVPELDAVDELFYRVINGKSASDIAAPAAIVAAKGIVDSARAEESEKDWKEFPNLGMIGGWSVTKNKDGEVLCLALDVGANNFKLRPAGAGFFITQITKTNDSCSK